MNPLIVVPMAVINRVVLNETACEIGAETGAADGKEVRSCSSGNAVGILSIPFIVDGSALGKSPIINGAPDGASIVDSVGDDDGISDIPPITIAGCDDGISDSSGVPINGVGFNVKSPISGAGAVVVPVAVGAITGAGTMVAGAFVIVGVDVKGGNETILSNTY